MLQERGELLYGDGPADIVAFLQYGWPFELGRFESISLHNQRRLIVWVNVDAGALAVSRKEDPSDELTFIADCEPRWTGKGTRRMICGCGSDVHELGVGYQVNEQGRDVWIVTGTRCPACGILASPVDWNVEGEKPESRSQEPE